MFTLYRASMRQVNCCLLKQHAELDDDCSLSRRRAALIILLHSNGSIQCDLLLAWNFLFVQLHHSCSQSAQDALWQTIHRQSRKQLVDMHTWPQIACRNLLCVQHKCSATELTRVYVNLHHKTATIAWMNNKSRHCISISMVWIQFLSGVASFHRQALRPDWR